MSRRISLPGADELFRTTAAPASSAAATGIVTPEPRPSLRPNVVRVVPDLAVTDPDAGDDVAHWGSQDSRDDGARAMGGPPAATATVDDTSPGLRSRQSRGDADAGGDRALSSQLAGAAAPRTRQPVAKRRRGAAPQPSGRIRHDEKITVYVSPEELLDLEQARLVLRADHGLAVDRGRIVREALAVVVADLEAQGEDSVLVRRLRAL